MSDRSKVRAAMATMAAEAPAAADPAEVWEPGTRVRLTMPDNPGHPRAHQSGEVLGARWFDPVHRWRYDRNLGRTVAEPVSPGCWLVRVRFAFPTVHHGTDWVIHDDWYLFGHELARE